MIDVQNYSDHRNIPIDRVGIRGLYYPIVVEDRDHGTQNTIGEFGLYVNLSSDVKGTHMSRFVEILSIYRHQINVNELPSILQVMREKLESDAAFLTVSFPYFVPKMAPVSKYRSLMRYLCHIDGALDSDASDFILGVNVPITTVCPCSKEISDGGAHNQRGEIRLRVRTSKFVWFEELIDIAELSASCDVHTLLKRNDEKYVTERAYSNPKFVEDVIRDVVLGLRACDGVAWAEVEVENFESVHNHSVYAKVVGDMSGQARGKLLSNPRIRTPHV